MAEATQKTANYTAEMINQMVDMYNELGNDGLDQIAEEMDKSVRSVRSKLVREGATKSALTRLMGVVAN